MAGVGIVGIRLEQGLVQIAGTSVHVPRILAAPGIVQGKGQRRTRLRGRAAILRMVGPPRSRPPGSIARSTASSTSVAGRRLEDRDMPYIISARAYSI